MAKYPTLESLIEGVRGEMRLRRLSFQTEETYEKWIRQFIVFHKRRNPEFMGSDEVWAFLAFGCRASRGGLRTKCRFERTFVSLPKYLRSARI